VTCREFADFIGDYLSGELQPDVRERFANHLEICENCQRYLAGYEATVKLGKRAFAHEDLDVPVDVPEDLVKAILASKQR
jgi:anti-sigma factor RsiW